MFAIFLFSGVILFQNFAASYTSYLSVVKEHTPFDSIQSLYEDTDFIIGTNNGTAYFEMFKVLTKIRLCPSIHLFSANKQFQYIIDGRKVEMV